LPLLPSLGQSIICQNLDKTVKQMANLKIKTLGVPGSLADKLANNKIICVKVINRNLYSL
jgi:hypothetical protein